MLLPVPGVYAQQNAAPSLTGVESNRKDSPADDESGEEGRKDASSEEPVDKDSFEGTEETADDSEDTSSGEAEESQATHVYSLDELLKLAGKNAAVIKEHEAKIRHAEWQDYRARRAWTPQIEANTLLAPVPADADPSRIQNNIDEILSFNIGPFIRQTVRVMMPVYTFGRISTAKELAELGVDVAKLQAEQARQEHFFLVKQAYYGHQLSQAFAKLLQEGDKLVKENLERMEDEADFGDADFKAADLRRLQIFNAELDTRLLDNQRLGDLTAAAINYLSGVDGEYRVEPFDTDGDLLELDTFERYWELAQQHRPEIVQLDHAVHARELALKLERRNYYPNIFLAADFGVGWSTENVAMQRVCRQMSDGSCVNDDTLFTRPYSNPFHSLTFGIALGMNWKLDFFGSHGKVQEAHALHDETLAQRERAMGALRLEIIKKHREAADNLQRVEIQRRAMSAARSWRNQFGAKLQVGRGEDLKDAIDPLKAYYEARVVYLEARHNYLVSRAALARSIGLMTIDNLELSTKNNEQTSVEE